MNNLYGDYRKPKPLNNNTKMRKSQKLLLTIMAILCLLGLFALSGCSQDDSDNCECLGQFGNTQTGEYIYQDTDCERTPPTKEYVFIKCVDKPDY